MFEANDVEEIRANIESSLRSCGIDTPVSLENFNKCISVQKDVCDEDSTNVWLWVRLMPMSNSKYSVDFSTVQLPSSMQRNGIFTLIFNNLKSCSKVGKLSVSSVCTQKMCNWCNKQNLETNDGFDYHIIL